MTNESAFPYKIIDENPGFGIKLISKCYPLADEQIAQNHRWLDWSLLSQNPNLNWSSDLIDHFESAWDWFALSSNTSLPWDIGLLEKFEERWEWDTVCSNAAITWTQELIQRFKTRLHYAVLIGNENFPWHSDYFYKMANLLHFDRIEEISASFYKTIFSQNLTSKNVDTFFEMIRRDFLREGEHNDDWGQVPLEIDIMGKCADDLYPVVKNERRLFINPNVSKLELSARNIRRIPDSFKYLKSLEYLDLSDNSLDIDNINPVLGELKQLKYLNISGNSLSVLPTAIKQLPELRSLVLSSDYFMDFEIESDEFPKLEEIHFTRLNMSYETDNFPQFIVALKRLRMIIFENADIYTMTNDISKLKTIRHLELKNLPIKTLPYEIGLLENLETLIIEKTELQDLPESICWLKKLNKIVLQDNAFFVSLLPVHIRNFISSVGQSHSG